MIGRRTAGRILRAAHLDRDRHRRGSSPIPTPISLDRSTKFAVSCIVGAWMEADVIGATVKNALTQGCERVFLVDNDSHDETVAEAV